MVVILSVALLHSPRAALSAVVPPPSVILAWDASPSAEATGYRIYYGAASGNYTNSVTVGNVTSNTFPGLVVGATYSFAVVAYNSIGLESIFSNEIIYTVPGGLAKLQIVIAANKQAILTVTGRASHAYEIQTTTNLNTWTILGTVTTGASGSANYTNTNAGSFSKRFYRTRDTAP
jgi:Fibronectin type III domain